MRRSEPRSAAVWWLAAALTQLVPGAAAADWPWPRSAPHDPRMARIIAAVRGEEAKSKDIEYVARITIRDVRRKDPNNPAEVTTLATRRVVLQGDRIFFRRQAFERVGAEKYRHEETSAYDGERTRTVIAGNCANIHLGRWQHPEVFPAHGLPLAHCEFNFPLSVYLSGTEAIHAHLGYTRGLVEAGWANTFRKVEARLDGEEQLDGLRSLRIRVYRWFQPNHPPLVQTLWLAPERNYHCIKEELLSAGFQQHQMHVDELREVAPGVWFPAKITVLLPNLQVRGQVLTRTETVVEDVALSPHRRAALFRDVAIPADLPVFTLEGRTLVGSMLPEPFDDDWGRKELAELTGRVAAQQERYDDLEVKARVVTRYLHSSRSPQNVAYPQLTEERSIVRGELAQATTRHMIGMPGGIQETGLQVNAYDGEWSRWFWRQGPPENTQGYRVTLRRGRMKTRGGLQSGVRVHRPHTLMMSPQRYVGSLEDLLASRAPDPSVPARFRVRYCGAAEVDGHPCVEVRGDSLQANFDQNGAVALYLATDRNDIPIKIVYYANYYNRLVPVSADQCGDFREIAPGTWYPFRFTDLKFDVWALAAQGWIVLNSRSDTTIESVGSASRVSDAAFREVPAPAGANVLVYDEARQFVGQFQQAEEGVPSLTLGRYLEILSRAPLQPHQLIARVQALDALIGKPAPAFPAAAAWLNGPPPNWEQLRGKVVVLGFWAEWNDACRDDLARLNRLHRDRAKDGPTILGVHTPGSEPAAIKKVVEALHLEFPVCVNAPAPEGTNAWGDLFGRFAVRSVPHAVVVNGEGKIVACGRLEDVLAKTRVLVEKRP